MSQGGDGGGPGGDGEGDARTYGPSTYDVTAAEARTFAGATDDPDPRFAGELDEGDPVPPMFCVVYARDVVADVLFDPELSLDLPRLVHGGQDLRFGAPVRVGDAVTTEGRVVEDGTRGDNRVVTCETTSTNQDDELVCEGRWTFVIRGGGSGTGSGEGDA